MKEEHKKSAAAEKLLDIYAQLDERDRHRLMLAAQALLAVAESNRRRGF